MGDREWSFEATDFDTALRCFNPTPLLALRTMKSDTAVGLNAGTVSRLNDTDRKWLESLSGRYGFIQFSDSRLPLDYQPPVCEESAKRTVSINESFNTVKH